MQSNDFTAHASKLDDRGAILRNDPSGMMAMIVGFFDQIREALRRSVEFSLDPSVADGVRNVLLCGMGGSGIGGDVIRSFLMRDMRVPFQVCRDFSIPGYVGSDSLAIISSYSGNTEETLRAFGSISSRDARTVCITSGGTLLRRAARDDIPHLVMPEGYPPRAALGFSLVYVLKVLQECRLIDDELEKLKGALATLGDRTGVFRPEIPFPDNPAKEIAATLYGKIPVIHSSCEFLNPVAYRWRCQLNENSKMLSFATVLPEDYHNGIMGWQGEAESGNPYIAVFFRDIGEEDRLRKNLFYLKSLLTGSGIPFLEVRSEGETVLERMLYLINLGDFVSCYLACLEDVDPTELKSIDSLKKII